MPHSSSLGHPDNSPEVVPNSTCSSFTAAVVGSRIGSAEVEFFMPMLSIRQEISLFSRASGSALFFSATLGDR